jgi:methionyl aminopeptidase
MINSGVPDGQQDEKDGWTVRTKDRRLSAQFEHTVMMGTEAPEVLTLTKNGPQRGHKF